MMFKDTLQTDIHFQIQLHNLKNSWSQWFITVPSLDIPALHGVAQETGREPSNLLQFLSHTCMQAADFAERALLPSTARAGRLSPEEWWYLLDDLQMAGCGAEDSCLAAPVGLEEPREGGCWAAGVVPWDHLAKLFKSGLFYPSPTKRAWLAKACNLSSPRDSEFWLK